MKPLSHYFPGLFRTLTALHITACAKSLITLNTNWIYLFSLIVSKSWEGSCGHEANRRAHHIWDWASAKNFGGTAQPRKGRLQSTFICPFGLDSYLCSCVFIDTCRRSLRMYAKPSSVHLQFSSLSLWFTFICTMHLSQQTAFSIFLWDWFHI